MKAQDVHQHFVEKYGDEFFVKRVHRKIPYKDDCSCGAERIFIFSNWFCVQKIQEELAPLGFKLERLSKS